MIRERDTSRKILNALMDYFVVMEYTSLEASIEMNNKSNIIRVSGTVNPDLLNIERLVEALKHPRLYEYDEYYAGILDSSVEDEIATVGFLVDHAKIDYEDDYLAIEIERLHK